MTDFAQVKNAFRSSKHCKVRFFETHEEPTFDPTLIWIIKDEVPRATTSKRVGEPIPQRGFELDPNSEFAVRIQAQ
jgi:hypothetical protein